MDVWTWVLIAAVVVALLAITILLSIRRKHRAALRRRFGAEYDRTVEAADSRRRAEVDLREREVQHAQLDLHSLAPAARDRYLTRWADLQAHFVDRPQVAVADADSMITHVMRDLGYPVDTFETNAALISVDHSDVVAKYREGHAIYTKTVEGTATTEDLRQAVLSYRALFEDLLRESADAERRV